MLEEMHVFGVPPETIDESSVALGTEPSHRLPLDCKCVLGFVPVLNVNRRLLRLCLHAAYLSQGRGGQCALFPLLPIFRFFLDVQSK